MHFHQSPFCLQDSPELLHKYIAINATHLIREEKPVEALQLYKRYGAPAFPQNFNIYKRIAVDLFSLPSNEDAGRNYYTWAALRDMLYDLTENMSGSGELDGSQPHEDFKLLLLISHYLGKS